MQTKYEKYLKSPQWDLRKNEKLRQATWVGKRVVCNGCHCLVLHSMGDVHVHHRTYARIGQELDSDLYVVCAGCHAFLHGEKTPDWWNDARRNGRLGSVAKHEIWALIQDFVANGRNAKAAAQEAAILLCPRIGATEDDAKHRNLKNPAEIMLG